MSRSAKLNRWPSSAHACSSASGQIASSNCSILAASNSAAATIDRGISYSANAIAMRTKSTRIWNQFPTAHSIVVILRALLHIDPPFRPDLAGALCVLGRQLAAADDPDLRLCVGSVGANPCLGIPTAIGFDGVDLDPIAAVGGDDDHL